MYIIAAVCMCTCVFMYAMQTTYHHITSIYPSTHHVTGMLVKSSPLTTLHVTIVSVTRRQSHPTLDCTFGWNGFERCHFVWTPIGHRSGVANLDGPLPKSRNC